MLKNVISVQTNILAARQRAKSMIIENSSNSINGNTSISVALITSIVAFLAFIGFAVSALLLKKKMLPSAEPILRGGDESSASYATFI